jgi:hypothetical protein
MPHVRTTTLAGLVLGSLAVVMVACGGGSSANLTPEQDASATALCGKTLSCQGVANPSAEQMNQCKDSWAGDLQIFPDPQAFASCINSLTCDQIDNDEQAVMGCADWDLATLKCSATDSDVLNGCNHAGKCVAANCNDVCKLMGYTYDRCGYDAERSADMCICRPPG